MTNPRLGQPQQDLPNAGTTQEEVLARLEEREAEVKALVKAAQVLFESDSFGQSARQVFDQACLITGATSGYVALLSPDGTENEVLFLEAGGLPCTVDPTLPMPIRGLRSEAYFRSEAVFDNDFSNSDWAKFLPEGHVVLRNVMFAPLVVNKKTVGIMGLANKEGDFSPRDRDMAAVFGQMAAVALRGRRILDALEETVRELQQKNDSLEEARRTIEKLASTDALTGTLTRREFDKFLAKNLSLVDRNGHSLAMLMADLDRFKSVNDECGHEAGDEVLRNFGTVLANNVRQEDVACRYGGDEFLVLLPMTDVEGARECAERILSATSELRFETLKHPITVSIGVSEYRHGETEASFRRRVDRALYEAKSGGRNRVHALSPEARG